MSYEVIQKVGKYRYIYLAEGYRNEKGLPRQKRTSIGKIDPVTGEKIYKPEYLNKLQSKSEPVPVSDSQKIFSIGDIKESTVLSFGCSYLLNKIAEHNGLLNALKAALPESWADYFTLACYMVSTANPLMYCKDWIETTETYPVGSFTSQQISRMLTSLRPEQRETFYRNWYAAHNDAEYLALDITSESSYSELIEDVEWGYNRDHEKLPQINLCVMMGENSRLPIYQTVYSGSHKDVSTLITTLTKFWATTGENHTTIVMDKGFFSKKNINFLLGSDDRPATNFLISMPFTSSFAKKQVESERKDIDRIENTIVINGYSMRAVTKVRAWDKEHKVYTHIYYNAKKACGIREQIYAEVATLKEKALAHPDKYADDEKCRKYLNIRKSEKQENGYTVSVRNDVIEKMLETSGWVVLISNHISDATQAMQIYRDKDVVEKCFLRLKNSIDMRRLRVHSDNATQGKLFVGFIASVIMAELNKGMSSHGLYDKYTLTELLTTLAKLRVQTICGRRILYPPTKEHRLIFDAFGFSLSDQNQMLL